MRDLFAELQYHFDVQPDRRGWCHVKCPYCGGEADKSQPRFSFNRKGFHCFVCPANGNLKELAIKTGLWTESYGQAPARTFVREPDPEPTEPPPLPAWRNDPEFYLRSYERDERRFTMWRAYKPLSAETIRKYHLGVGYLPDLRQNTRLIVPLYWQKELVGFKGRVLAHVKEDKYKWIAAKTSMVDLLHGIEHVPPNPRQLWICENYIDAILITQNHGHYAVAAGGARGLKPYEIEALVELAPKIIVVAYDNDLVGQAGPTLRKKLEEEWMVKNNAQYAPASNAARVVESLQNVGLRTHLFPYPAHAPHKADIMWALDNQVQ